MSQEEDIEEQYDDVDEAEINQADELMQIMLKQHEEQLSEKTKYARPQINFQKTINPSLDIYCMQIDCDHYIDARLKTPIIRVFAINKIGNSILLHISGFIPYFYIQCPMNMKINQTNIEELRKEINRRAVKTKCAESIVKIEVVEKESIKEFKGVNFPKLKFLKIYTAQPSHVANLRGLFENTIKLGELNFSTKTYESNMPYALRFMIDKDIVGMGWILVKANKYKIRPLQQHVSKCQVEIDVDVSDVEGVPSQGEWSEIAPLRILSFDIECSAEKGFPNAFTKDHHIIQIASVVKIHNQEEEIVNMVLTLNTCANIPGAIVKCFQKEQDLLNEFQRFIQMSDPDFFLGYNITNFDFPYILNRAKFLNMKEYGYFGRILTDKSVLSNGKYLSKQMGMRETQEMNLSGRIQLDMFIHMHRDQKLSSYSLNSVSEKFLKQQKEDVHHSMIHVLQNGNEETRKRLAVYCLKDAQLPIRLMDKLMCIYNYSEMARVTGVPINFLFTRGQQIKVASQLYRKAKEVGYIIPSERNGQSDGKYEGAYVLDPVVGYYKEPIATLDFASLYPSIMMAHNLCYSTQIRELRLLNDLKLGEDYIKTPHDCYFVTQKIRKGLLPLILEDLLGSRKKARQELALETDPMRRAVLDGRQLALKISANSVYGFTGAQVGQLPCLDISTSVTKFGKQMLNQTRDAVLNSFPGSQVIYGDTDSIMVKFGVKTVEEAMNLGREAAKMITKLFKDPIKLEFEKIYFPYLLMNRKRYAGLYWTKTEKYDKIDTKGIENVRRDNCPLIRQMIDKCLKMLLVDMDEVSIVDYVKQVITNLLQNKIDVSQLIITKALSKKGADDNDEEDNKNKKDQKKNDNVYKSKQAHVELAKKMAQRDVGSAPQIGDRVPYLIISGTKGSKNHENAEDPIYVLEKDLPIDYDYYIEKQIKQPLMRLLEHVLPNPESLFQGEHCKNKYVPKAMGSSLGGFLIIKQKCLGCRVPLKDEKEPLCQECVKKGKTVDIYTEKLVQLNQLQQEYHEAWTECQRCQGSLHDSVICTNRDCPIFYKRQKLKKDLTATQNIIDRFNNDW